MYKLIKPILFLFDAERVHNFTMAFISRISFFYPLFKIIYAPKKTEGVTIAGMQFHNRLGLAAGLDKNGIAIRFWNVIGFSHIEVGTVTPLPQPGNEKPRIFRLIQDKALINRLGFNNKGADRIRENILNARKHIRGNFIIGVNIGKNKITPNEKAAEDYLVCLEKLYDAADYFTVNISSPNTEGLRELQGAEYIQNLLQKIQELNKKLSKETLKPVFVKIAPDLQREEIEVIYSAAVKNGITGIIATNTTTGRDGLTSNIKEQGGLSGKPLKQKADTVLKGLSNLNLKNENNKIVLIGAGGVFNRRDFSDKVSAGASLVQIYTGLIYEGPAILKRILNGNE